MTRKTALISFIVEFDDEETSNTPTDYLQDLAGDMPDGFTVIGTPHVDLHDRPVCSVSRDEFIAVTVNMNVNGGGFAQGLSLALSRGDSGNQQRLLDTFWNTFCSYWRS